MQVQDEARYEITYAAGTVQPQLRHLEFKRGGPTGESPQSSDLLLAEVGTCNDEYLPLMD